MNLLYQNIGDELNLGNLSSVDIIQTLWSGYGKLVRLNFPTKSIIVKHVQLPKPSEHPRGWNSDVSHQRKLHSYQVEVNWYENFSQTISERYPIPQGLKSVQKENEWLIVMEDLSSAGFPSIIKNANRGHLEAVLYWLANFHACYMGRRSELIWRHGTYWHIETRLDELEALKDKELKKFAKDIDNALEGNRYQTIVHGDAKLANFCFNNEGNKCAALDFQYVGHGCGMKDVALFMSSSVAPEACKEMEAWVLQYYFTALDEALKHYQPHLNSAEIEKEWRPMFALAWADFQRFIKGWSPNHYKINAYTERLTQRALGIIGKRY